MWGLLQLLASLVLGCWTSVGSSASPIFTHQWAAQIPGGIEKAREVAERHGFELKGEIFEDHYHLHHHEVMRRSVYPSDHHHERLTLDEDVLWAEQQVVKKRVKRDVGFNDPKWQRMWYLRRGKNVDMNVEPAWRKGITGRDIVVSILDDGIEKDHPDLKKNYDAKASYDVNGRDNDPQPRYDYTNENRHGTRCAGEVAAEADNGICSVGVAYNARIGGVRMLDGDVTDLVEATSLGHNPQHIDIYSASWGPDDDGRTVDGPAVLARKAFYNGITKGRKGKGSIFVWASGNGGRDGDSCNCDGYTNSIYTLSISSATMNGNIPWYSEACSSTLASTYSSGSGQERQIVTTDLRKSCTENHTGTSASAPLAAGICALVLQANPNLSWRDMQHIVVMTARPADLIADDWVTNGVGKRVSHSFGYGLMDAAAMVELARNWTTVPEQHSCEIKAKVSPQTVPAFSKIKVTLESDGCRRSSRNKVMYLEHVQSIVTLSTSRRGDVQIFLTSPQGTKSTLLQKRNRDTSSEGFDNWAFMTTHNWGEIAMGRWMLEVENGDSTSELRSWTLVMFGTSTHARGNDPNRYQEQKQPIYDTTAWMNCAADEFQLNNFCYKECPRRFYPAFLNFTTSDRLPNGQPVHETHAVCLQCSSFCLECFGSGENECLTCSSGYGLKNHKCSTINSPLAGGMSDHFAIVLGATLACAASIVCCVCVFLVLQARDGDEDDDQGQGIIMPRYGGPPPQGQGYRMVAQSEPSFVRQTDTDDNRPTATETDSSANQWRAPPPKPARQNYLAYHKSFRKT